LENFLDRINILRASSEVFEKNGRRDAVAWRAAWIPIRIRNGFSGGTTSVSSETAPAIRKIFRTTRRSSLQEKSFSAIEAKGRELNVTARSIKLLGIGERRLPAGDSFFSPTQKSSPHNQQPFRVASAALRNKITSFMEKAASRRGSIRGAPRRSFPGVW